MARQDVDQGDLSRKRVLWARALAWLAVIGVFPLSLAQWGPWVFEGQAIRFPGDTTATHVQVPLDGYMGLPNFLVAHGFSKPVLVLGVMWLWLALAPAGIFPALALAWLRASRIATVVYIAWLIVVTSISAIVAFQLFGASRLYSCVEPYNCPTVSLLSRQPGWGAWVTLGAFALLWIAAGARVFSPSATFSPSSPAWAPERTGVVSHPTAVWRIGAVAFTLGALIWGFGLILTPWATHNCAGFPISWTHFVHGACVGLDANDAMAFVWPAQTLENALKFTMFLVFMGLLGVVAMGALWRQEWGGPVVAAIWAVLASWLFSQALSGLDALLKNPTQLTFATSAAWVMGAGPLVTSIGVALFWAGVVSVWIGAGVFRSKPRAAGLTLQSESASAGQG